jgi:hypothetical protein
MAEERTDTVDLDAPLVKVGGFVENAEHKPNPYFQYGTLETTDLGSTPAQQLAGVSPVFEEARAETMRTAARALDPNDTTVSPDLVILPSAQVIVQGSARTSEEARQEVVDTVQRLTDDPIVVGVSPAAREAAQGTAPEDTDDAVSDEGQAKAETDRVAAARMGSTTEPAGTSAGTTRKPAATASTTKK